MKKVRKKGLSGATAVVTPLIFYCPLEHSANAVGFFITRSLLYRQRLPAHIFQGLPFRAYRAFPC